MKIADFGGCVLCVCVLVVCCANFDDKKLKSRVRMIHKIDFLK